MIFLKKALVVMLLAVMCLFAACNSDSADKGAVIGTVNGVNVYQSEYDYFFSNIFLSNYSNSYYSYMGIDFNDEESAKDTLAMFESTAWQYTVNFSLIEQLAEEYGITYEDNYMQDILPWGYYRAIKISDLQAQLMEKVREEMLAEIEVSEEEIQAAYDTDPALWDGRSTSHILISCDVNDEAALAEAKAEAEDIIAQLNNGAEFADLAKEYSDDGSASNGGVIDAYINSDGNEVGTENSYYTEYVDAAYALTNVGDYTSEPVLSSAGYHIIKIDDIRSGYDAVKDIVADSLKTVSDDDVYARIDEILAERYDAADIQIKYDFKYYVPESDDAADDTVNNDDAANDDSNSEDGNTDDTANNDTSGNDDTAGQDNSGSSDDPEAPTNTTE